MADLDEQLALKARLPRTWPAFFARHGRFTPAQIAAIPPLLEGANLLLCAPTASGKTAAVLAPLIERHCPPLREPAPIELLCLVPTRALVNDLLARLAHPLESLGLRLAAKTRERSLPADARADLLITTPEGADALLAAGAGRFAGLRAIIVDELHLFDGTPRGDQLRAVLARLRQVRSYAATHGDARDSTLQLVALSATLAAPQAAAARYLGPAQVVEVAGARPVKAELIDLQAKGVGELRAYLARFQARGWRKALVFCNSRAEVERYAAALRPASPFGSAVFVHYSNLEGRRRVEIEARFAEATSALCVASSTLELGIDIGTVDTVVLIGPPAGAASLAQRVGRGNRRGQAARAACCYRTALERLLFEAMLDEVAQPRAPAAQPSPGEPGLPAARPSPGEPGSRARFRPSVAVQQIFSLIRQSPTASLRLAPLAELFAGLLDRADLEAIVGELTIEGYLKPGRPGEWRPGPRLNQLFDEQLAERPSLSIYSNIRLDDAPTVAIRDSHSQEIIARVSATWLSGEQLTLEGRPISVEWSDGEALWVSTRPGGEAGSPAIYRAARPLLSHDLARLLPARLGLPTGEAALVPVPGGCYCFHWMGDLYGRALLDLLGPAIGAADTSAPGLALELREAPRALPTLSAEDLLRYLRGAYRQYEPLLDLGPFQPLLPPALRQRAVVEQFDVARFLAAYSALAPRAASPEVAAALEALLT